VINRRFPYLHIAFILLLSIVFIPPAFAIEARYVKVLIDGTSKPYAYNCYALISIADIKVLDFQGINVSVGKSYTATSNANLQLDCSMAVDLTNDVYLNYLSPAFDGDSSTFYFCCRVDRPLGAEWVMVDLGAVMNVLQVLVSTYDGAYPYPLDYGFYPVTSSPPYFSPLTDYRILVSNDNLNWTLAAVVTNAAGTTRTDTITLEDLGGGMDIDINYVVALFLSILVLGFLRQIFF